MNRSSWIALHAYIRTVYIYLIYYYYISRILIFCSLALIKQIFFFRSRVQKCYSIKHYCMHNYICTYKFNIYIMLCMLYALCSNFFYDIIIFNSSKSAINFIIVLSFFCFVLSPNYSIQKMYHKVTWLFIIYFLILNKVFFYKTIQKDSL